MDCSSGTVSATNSSFCATEIAPLSVSGNSSCLRLMNCGIQIAVLVMADGQRISDTTLHSMNPTGFGIACKNGAAVTMNKNGIEAAFTDTWLRKPMAVLEAELFYQEVQAT
jgi:hypothetical protein